MLFGSLEIPLFIALWEEKHRTYRASDRVEYKFNIAELVNLPLRHFSFNVLYTHLKTKRLKKNYLNNGHGLTPNDPSEKNNTHTHTV